MATINPQSSAQQLLQEQLLQPIEDAVKMARRYRDVDGLREYVSERLQLVIPACVLVLVAAFAFGLTPLMLLLGTRALASLAGLLLTPLTLIGSLFVLSMLFFSWLEKRALARALGPRGKTASNKLTRWVRRKLGADLGAPPDVPWLLALIFVVVPFALLLKQAPFAAVVILVLLVAAPILFARLDR